MCFECRVVVSFVWNGIKMCVGSVCYSYLGRGGDGKRVMLGVSYNLPNMKFYMLFVCALLYNSAML